MAGSHEKILFTSIVFLLGLNLLVAPLIEESGEATLPIMDPPEHVMLSDDYESPPEPDSYIDAITRTGTIAIDLANSVIWLVLSLGSTLFGGSFSHPLLILINALLGIIASITLLRLLRGN